MWQILEKNGSDDFTAWIGRLLYENSEVTYVDTVPGVSFVKIDAVKLLYDILDMKLLGGFTLQNFFYLLQQAAEDM